MEDEPKDMHENAEEMSFLEDCYNLRVDDIIVGYHARAEEATNAAEKLNEFINVDEIEVTLHKPLGGTIWKYQPKPGPYSPWVERR